MVLLDAQRHARRLGKGLVDAAIPHGRALEVPQGSYPAGNLQTLLIADGRFLLARLLATAAEADGRGGTLAVGVVVGLLAEIALEGYEDELGAGAVVGNLAYPFRFDVFERIFALDGEAEHDEVGVV